jgi:hypothetical protein
MTEVQAIDEQHVDAALDQLIGDERTRNAAAKDQHLAASVPFQRPIDRLVSHSLIGDEPIGCAGTQFHGGRLCRNWKVMGFGCVPSV